MMAKIVYGIVLVLALATVPAWAAQSGGVNQGPKYDASTETTIQGEVVETGASGLLGLGSVQEVTVKTDRESWPVILGPKNYLDTQNVKIEKGEKVTVIGSKVMIDDKPTIIAREVKKGNDVLTLRRADGTPVWTQTTNMQTQGQYPQAQTGSDQGSSGETGQAQGGGMSDQGQQGTSPSSGSQGMEQGSLTPTPISTPAEGGY
jgi:hypothetical protein